MQHKIILHIIVFAIAFQLFFNYVVARDVQTIKRHSVKIVKTKYGDIYDCVDVYNQPALSHPLLKDHKIQMKPTSNLKFPSVIRNTDHEILERIECPERTIPIRRDNYKRMQKGLVANSTGFGAQLDKSTGFDSAGITIKPNSGKTFTGASATIAIYNPPHVEDKQLSAAIITIQSGVPNNIDYIDAGWMVYPDYFHDIQTRLVTAWRQDRNDQDIGCFNTDCALFIQTNHRYALGAILPNVSHVKKSQYSIPIALTLDSGIGGWWLSVNNIQLGYWPTKHFLGNLAHGADEIFMGGMVYSGKPYSPPMGSGGDFEVNYQTTCYMKKVTVKQQHSSFVDPSRLFVQANDDRCYQSRSGKVDGDYGYVFVFGGPGGSLNDCFAMDE